MNGFRVANRACARIPHRDRFGLRDRHVVFHDRDDFDIVLPDHVVDQLHALARRAAPREFLGVVYGLVFQDCLGRFALVAGIVPIDDATATEDSVASTPSGAVAAESLAERLYPGSQRLGWAHSHPRLGTRYSITDEQNQATYSSPDAVGIVVDPWCTTDRGLGVYRGPRSVRLDIDEHGVAPMDSARAPDASTRSLRLVPQAGPIGERWAVLLALAASVLLIACGIVLGAHLAASDRRLGAVERGLRTTQVACTARTRARAPAAVPGDAGADASR